MLHKTYSLSEGKFKGYQNINLFFQTWEVSSPKGALVITHGQGEHSDAYHRLANGIADAGWNLYAWDLRGHGRSEGRRGYAADFLDYCHDYELFLDRVRAMAPPNLPMVTLGHSMGGLIQTRTTLDHLNWNFKAQVLSAPLFGLAMEVPWIKDRASRLINQVLPALTLGNEIKFTDLSRDPDVIAEYEKDPLRTDRISAGVYLGFIEAMNYVRSRAAKLHYKTLMQIPMADKVTNAKVSCDFFDQIGSPDKKLVTYEKAPHEIYNDIDREKAYTDLKKFLAECV